MATTRSTPSSRVRTAPRSSSRSRPCTRTTSVCSTALFPAEAANKDTDTFNTGWTEINPDWFGGPFTLGNWSNTTAGTVEEIPNPNWWGDKPLLDKIIFRTVVSPDAVPQGYANGELDSFDIGPDPNGFSIAESTRRWHGPCRSGHNWRQITFNSTAGLIADQTIRQAIVRGLDRGKIGSSDLAGIPWPAKPASGNHVFVENQKGYVDNGVPTSTTTRRRPRPTSTPPVGRKAVTASARKTARS